MNYAQLSQDEIAQWKSALRRNPKWKPSLEGAREWFQYRGMASTRRIAKHPSIAQKLLNIALEV